MKALMASIQQTLEQSDELPFSVYTSVQEQRISNVPIFKPLLICVLAGSKQLVSSGTQQQEAVCSAGQFICLSNHSNIGMRNIPKNDGYFALMIEFEYQDFDCFRDNNMLADSSNHVPFFEGEITSVLEQTLKQFVEWSCFAPKALWSIRRQELLQTLLVLGYAQVRHFAEPPYLSHKVFNRVSQSIGEDTSAETMASELAMSESTLRRKLSAEGTSFQEIKDQVRLGLGLHLVQTTDNSIGSIAEQCGYSSQSRFTDKFKQLFHTTPTNLRKTRLG